MTLPKITPRDVPRLLVVRERELSDLLELIVTGLKDDDRVSAAWLAGSLARGDNDALSDIDLRVVVRDEDVEKTQASRHSQAAWPSEPILLMDNWMNAPSRGAYLLALYPGEVGPHWVDWFWEQQSLAAIPDDGLVLFDRAGLSVIRADEWYRRYSDGSRNSELPSASESELLTHHATFFWAMSLIVAKYIARRNGDVVARMTRVIARRLDVIEALITDRTATRGYESPLQNMVEASAENQFEALSNLTDRMALLHNRINEQGAELPLSAMPYVQRFHELTRAMTQHP